MCETTSDIPNRSTGGLNYPGLVQTNKKPHAISTNDRGIEFNLERKALLPGQTLPICPSLVCEGQGVTLVTYSINPCQSQQKYEFYFLLKLDLH